LDWLGLDVPLETVVAPADVQVRKAATLFHAKHTDESITECRHGAIVNSLHARHVVPADDRIARVPPHHVAGARRSFLPGNRSRRRSLLDGRANRSAIAA
jgi:hypothetical protein